MLLTSILCLSLFLQCKDENTPDLPPDVEVRLNAKQTEVLLPHTAGSYTLPMDAAGGSWEVQEDMSWLEAVKMDNAMMRVTYEQNKGEERKGIVTASMDTISLEITVTQSANLVPSFGGETIPDQTYIEDVQISDLILPEATGGNDKLTYSLTPAPPAGLIFETDTRTLSGTPEAGTAVDAQEFTYTATDADSDKVSLSFTITIEEDTAPVFANTPIADQGYIVDVAITSPTFPTASGGNAPLSYGVSPALPSNLSFDFTTNPITLKGIPDTADEQDTYTITVTDANKDTDTFSFKITVNPDTAPVFANTQVADQNYTTGVAITSPTFPTASGGNAPLSYGVSPALPNNLSFDFTTNPITLKGTPDTADEQDTYTITVTDANKDTDTFSFKITVNANTAPVFASTSVADQVYIVGVAITSPTFPTASGGNAPLGYGVSPALPGNLSFDFTTNPITLKGTPDTADKQDTYTVTVTDANKDTDTFSFKITVNPDTAPVFASTSVANQVYIVGVAITSPTFPTASGGNAPLSYGVSPALPNNLSFDFTTNPITLSGIPSANDAQDTYTITVTDANKDTDTFSFKITVNPDTAPVFANTQVADQNYTTGDAITSPTFPMLTPGNGALGDHTYIVSSGNAPAQLPSGLSFDFTTNPITLSGIPRAITDASGVTYTVTARDVDGDPTMFSFKIIITAGTDPSFESQTLPDQNYVIGTLVSLAAPALTGGRGTPSYEVTSGTLPDGLTIDMSTGAISGTPNTAKLKETYTITATKALKTATFTVAITVEANTVPTFGDKTIVSQVYTVGKAIGDVVLQQATEGNYGLVYSITEALPAGLDFNSETWTLSGVPNTEQVATDYTLKAVDSDNNMSSDEATLTFSITIRAASHKPIILSGETLQVTASSKEDATVTLTSELNWEATKTAEWITSVTPEMGMASVTAEAITLVYTKNDNTASRTGTITFTEKTAGASPKFTVTLTVTQAGRQADGLISISNLEQLHAMRYDLNGDGKVDHKGDKDKNQPARVAYAAAFTHVVYNSSAPARYTGYKLTKTLDFKEAGSYASGSVNADWLEATTPETEGWLHVGLYFGSSAQDLRKNKPFSGTFDGQGFEIQNLYMKRPTFTGLFALVTGTIKNLGIVNAKVTSKSGESAEQFVGGLAAVIGSGSTISGCYASGGTIDNKTNFGYSGCLIGFGSGTIRNCYVSGASAKAIHGVGGLIAWFESGTIGDCYASGVTTSGSESSEGGSAGLVGRNEGTISSCYASGGNHSGSLSSVGGLVGYNTGTISGCYVSGGAYSGSGSSVGGLVGYSGTGGTISGCYVSGGSITGTTAGYSASSGGGLVGQLNGTASGCYVMNPTLSVVAGRTFRSGSWVDVIRTGSLVGDLYGGEVIACYAGGKNYTNLIGRTRTRYGSNSTEFPGAVTNSYYQAETVTDEDNASTTVQAKTASALQTPVGYTGIYAKWNDLDGDDATDTRTLWDFGSNTQYPALKGIDVDKDGTIEDSSSAADDIAGQR